LVFVGQCHFRGLDIANGVGLGVEAGDAQGVGGLGSRLLTIVNGVAIVGRLVAGVGLELGVDVLAAHQIFGVDIVGQVYIHAGVFAVGGRAGDAVLVVAAGRDGDVLALGVGVVQLADEAALAVLAVDAFGGRVV